MKRATSKPTAPQTVASDDILTDFKELTADYTNPTISEEEKLRRKAYGMELAEDPYQAKVKIYKWKSTSGWHYDVKIPVLKSYNGKSEYQYDHSSGYAMTKVGAKHCVNKILRKHARQQLNPENNIIEFTVPVKPGTGTRRTGIKK